MNKVGDIVPICKKYANAPEIYYRIINVTEKSMMLRKLRINNDSYNQIDQGVWEHKFQLDFNDYPFDEKRRIKRKYIEPYCGDGYFSFLSYD